MSDSSWLISTVRLTFDYNRTSWGVISKVLMSSQWEQFCSLLLSNDNGSSHRLQTGSSIARPLRVATLLAQFGRVRRFLNPQHSWICIFQRRTVRLLWKKTRAESTMNMAWLSVASLKRQEAWAVATRTLSSEQEVSASYSSRKNISSSPYFFLSICLTAARQLILWHCVGTNKRRS